jgi:hypothetical protein
MAMRTGEPVEPEVVKFVREQFGSLASTAPIKLLESVPLVHKGRGRAETEKRTIAKANLKRMQAAQADRQKIHDIVLKLYELKPELRRAKPERLAREVQAVLKRQGITDQPRQSDGHSRPKINFWTIVRRVQLYVLYGEPS